MADLPFTEGDLAEPERPAKRSAFREFVGNVLRLVYPVSLLTFVIIDARWFVVRGSQWDALGAALFSIFFAEWAVSMVLDAAAKRFPARAINSNTVIVTDGTSAGTEALTFEVERDG